MGLRVRVLVTTVAVAAICFPLTFVIWPPEVRPTSSTLAQAFGYGLLAGECLAFGGGIAFLAFGYPVIKGLAVSWWLAIASYVGIAFYLLNWWPHVHLRAIAANLDLNGSTLMRQAIFLFHDGMMVFGAVLALFFAAVLVGPARQARRSSDGPRAGGRAIDRFGVRWKFAILAALIAVASVPLRFVAYGLLKLPYHTPPAWALPGLSLNALLTSVALGIGIGFLIFSLPLVKRAQQFGRVTPLAYLSIGWYLVCWLAYQGVDFAAGHDLVPGNAGYVLALGYGFHLPLMLAAVVLALFFYRVAHPAMYALTATNVGGIR